ncbi:P-loop containing nucleoside triphosphate hydrolase protein [Aspergillus campestris IBT 28561]|uniref:P-loop containing nucleoside triphosphate hydrolase protein n=1 Tax=Aspergillus campestris (strain IBT 28561) TaxID=1392248 RepID=A0A2I1CRM8_ASPC2|nr:P-loop containing nucleoside triphosphate hydrolase protein [Aspergillus campestris IBT 28561]PKY00286.1 P-loop containing nucleoside triphosphate hydrolase protein [Aspergillus campestris IBT 28561]
MTTDQPDITLATEEKITASDTEMDTTHDTHPTQTPDNPESGIVYHRSDEMLSRLRRSAERPTIQLESTHEWLWVTPIGLGSNMDSWEIVLRDNKLRDCIAKVIAKYNGHIGSNVWQESRVTLSSPFKALIFNHAELKIEAQSTSLDPTTRGRLQCLLQVVEKIHDPVRWRIPKLVDDLWNFRIQYALLWTLFRPGSLVVGAWNSAHDLQVFQVHDTSYSSKEKTLYPTDHVYARNELVITAWMWDWDGKKIVRTMFDFRISEYSGDKPPAELKCYPVAFYDGEGHRGLEAIRGTSVYRDRRTNFLRYALDHRHLGLQRYSGDLYGGISAFQSNREKADMAAMGFRAALWPTVPPRVVKIDEDIILDTVNYMRKGGGSRALNMFEPVSSAKFCHCQLCLNPETKRWRDDTEAKVTRPFNYNDLLLPPRLFGFALNWKEWGQFFLNDIERTEPAEMGEFEGEMKGLVLPDEVSQNEQRHIFTMVSNHWHVMAKPRGQRIADMIGGKGESLILLFHGHSGTGKTLYAESLAKSSGRPLFKVGTSDIGLNAPRAERTLKNIFELAEAWKAVLLIDEADVLLDARGSANESLVTKNALVSVLLREVEYFKGVLIMTTNRVVAFDPAILSRIHHAVNFGEPNSDQEYRIWKLWIDRLHEQGLCDDSSDLRKWAKETTKASRRYILSGREIRNVFIMAQMLVERPNSDLRIKREHLTAAYNYKKDFRTDTEHLRTQANQLLAAQKK